LPTDENIAFFVSESGFFDILAISNHHLL